MLRKIDAFVVGLMFMIVLAWFYPQPGVYSGLVNLELLTDIGITLIFFFYGLKLSPKQMQEGLRNYRLHIVVQLATFVLFPSLVILLKPLMITEEQQLLWLAVFFLAVLPSTVSSSVVMVVLAKGNMVGAIFNASISGLIGIIVTPLWIGLFWNIGGAEFDFSDIIIGLLLKILLPVILGLLLHNNFGGFMKKHLKQLARFDKAVILLIVYKSFSKSFSAGLFNEISWVDLMWIGLAVVSLFMIVYAIIALTTRALKFNREDRITALFCGSKKSLVHGSVFSKVMFQNIAGQGIFLIPIMIYHTLQLLVISVVAQRMSKKVSAQ